MNFDVDYILGLMREISESNYKLELGEDEGDTTSDTSTSTPTSTGKKWSSGRTFGKTYMNDPNYKWESGRTMGKTYQGPGYVWDSGVSRGHANPVESTVLKNNLIYEQTTDTTQSETTQFTTTNEDDAKTIDTIFGKLVVPYNTVTYVKETDFSKPWGEHTQFMSSDNLGTYYVYVLTDKSTGEEVSGDTKTGDNRKWTMTYPESVTPGARTKALYLPEPSYFAGIVKNGKINGFEIQGVYFTYLVHFDHKNNNKQKNLSFFNPTMQGMRGWTMNEVFYYQGADGKWYPYNKDTFIEKSWWVKWGSLVIIGAGFLVSIVASVFSGGLIPALIIAGSGILAGLHDIYVADNPIGGAIGIILSLVGLGAFKYITVSPKLLAPIINAFKGVTTEAGVLAAYEGLSVTEKQIFRKVFEQSPQVLEKSLETFIKQETATGIQTAAQTMGKRQFISTINKGIRSKTIAWEKIPYFERIAVKRAVAELGVGASLLAVGWNPMMDDMDKKEEERQKKQLQFAQTRLANMSTEELAKSFSERTPEELNALVGGNIDSAKSEVHKIAEQVNQNPDTSKTIKIDMSNKDQDIADVLSGFDFE